MRELALGRLHVARVYEGDAVIPLSVALPEIDAEDLSRLRSWYWDPDLTDQPATANVRISVHSYVLRVDGRNILIDTCCGNDKQRSLAPVSNLHTQYLENLARVGLQPTDIHLVMCTHLHFDHVGWNTRLDGGRWIPTFPNARYLFGRQDLDFFRTQRHEATHREAFDDSVAPILEAGLADIVDVETPIHREIGDGVWLEDASGHSPGNLCVVAQGGAERAIFSGDCFHHPIQLVRPAAGFFADEDPKKAGTTRQRLLERHAGTDAVFFPAHFTGATAGRVERESSGGFRFRFIASRD
jgi:glyoxylase-like metal-dependent hydrolase (beta-lactamase superfamily II)